MTVPNLITSMRIILTPVFIIYLINNEFELALIVFAVCSVSDGVDGILARTLNQKSTLGTFLDPLADKILLVASFIVLAVKDLLPSWLTVLVISRDIMILLGVLILFLNGLDIKIKPSILSKINTCLQFITIVIVLSKDIFFSSISDGFYLFPFYLTAMLTISSGLHYMHYWFRVLGDGANDRRNPKIGQS
ncbi:MAG: CDP-alcohol phosphatidyltransferase family protein [Pseudomonadota bacterium]